jgi:hypothetical protein
LRGHGGDEIGPRFLGRESHLGIINQGPAAKAAFLARPYSGA